VAVVVHDAPPVLTALAPAAVPVGSGGAIVTITGTGFQPGAVAQLDGADRPTVRTSPTQLKVTLGWADLATSGRRRLRVKNPIAPADTSASLELPVTNPAPIVTRVTPAFGTAGLAPTILSVEGTGFAAGATIEWNHSARPTTVAGPGRLEAQLTAGDLAAPGTVPVRVVNPDPADGPSADVPYRVDPPGRHVLQLQAGDLVADPVRKLLYAAIRATDSTYGNQVIAIDPVTGLVVRSLLVGSDPYRLALASDGSCLWVALDGAGTLQRIDLNSFTAGPELSVGTRSGQILFVEQMLPRPGYPEQLAITLGQKSVIGPSSSRGAVGIAIYDSGVPRPAQLGAFNAAFMGSDTLYLYTAYSTSNQVARALVADSGLAQDTYQDRLIGGFDIHITTLDGLIFSTDGQVVDPIAWTRLAQLPSYGAIAVDTATHRAFYYYQQTLTAVSSATLSILGTEVQTGLPAFGFSSGRPPHLVQFGADGFAYLTVNQIVMFTSPLALP
jgi:hypothetical protein